MKPSKVKSSKKVSSSSLWHVLKYVLCWLSTLFDLLNSLSFKSRLYSSRDDETDSKTKQNKIEDQIKCRRHRNVLLRRLIRNNLFSILLTMVALCWCIFFVNGGYGMCQVSKLMMMMCCYDVMGTYGMLWWVFWFLQIRKSNSLMVIDSSSDTSQTIFIWVETITVPFLNISAWPSFRTGGQNWISLHISSEATNSSTTNSSTINKSTNNIIAPTRTEAGAAPRLLRDVSEWGREAEWVSEWTEKQQCWQ